MTVEVPRGLTRAEQETVIRWDAEERVVWVWTADPSTLRKLHRLGLAHFTEARRKDGGLHGREYRIPLADFRWGLRRRSTRRDRPFLPAGPREEATSSTEPGRDDPTPVPAAPARSEGQFRGGAA